MNQKTTIISILISAMTGFIAAAVMCFVFFFYVYRPAAQVDENQPQKPPVKNLVSPTQTPGQEIPVREIKESGITSLSLETVYKEYFEESSKCRKSYDEFYGNRDGVFSAGSPCNLKLTFNRDGSATKIIEMRRYDKAAGGWSVAEKSEWKAKISDEQFTALAKNIGGNDAFKNYRDGVMVTASNSKVTVNDVGGAKIVMSNVDEKTTVFLAMMNAFRELEGKVNWEKV